MIKTNSRAQGIQFDSCITQLAVNFCCLTLKASGERSHETMSIYHDKLIVEVVLE